ncbi:hypothetical protein LTR36_007310 [Oleoguttula mirabilis]|uniref:AAA+ ATPase domain-containing protein n=1 Tax=Oleoguttula mirabilis TaxID=1507867 RepID=A0AAV9JBJ4_9PEZI|nr:hypothetical protein LTR36_007310 [Oleoguttula mirabilis]
MSLPNSDAIPGSDDLATLFTSPGATQNHPSSVTSFSDDFAALHDLEDDTTRAKTATKEVVRHRTWKTAEIFRSEPCEPTTSSPLQMPYMASSPPPTPSPHKKRKFADLDLGVNQLARPAKAQRTYYGIDIHRLLDDAQAEESIPKPPIDLPTPPAEQASSKKPSLLWTEKYRARKFTDLIGDERTHRSVMHWLKRWDQVVFPGSYRPKQKTKASGEPFEEKPHRKILLLTGPPGLGKTTLAHVCAKQAGYEVQEINASDERSSSVVKGRIRDMVGTENVKGVDTKTVDGKVRKAGKPVCVIVDEVDGVVSGSGGGGEGGFVKALIDLVMLDQKNSSALGTLQQGTTRKKKGDRFRLLRPLVLICNDVYHPSLRPLRQSSHAEVIHVRKPQISSIVSRMQAIFDREGVPCEGDGVRRLCEATWGVSNRKEDRSGNGAGEGDMRGILVVGEWVAGKLRSMNDVGGDVRLTRRWVEEHILQDLGHGGGAARGMGRGGPKDIVERVFKEGAGFPKSSATVTTPQHQSGGASTTVKGVAEGLKRTATDRLRQLLDTHSDTDRIMTDCFTSYPEHPFQDDTLMSKPAAAYEWLHFHDALASAVYTSNEWEMAPYLSTPVLAFHHLFASPTRAQYAGTATHTAADTEDDAPPPHPFTGPQASWAAREATKHHAALLQTLQSTLGLELSRLFSSTSDIATDLLPYLLRMLSPNVTPTIVGGSGTDKGTASVRKASEQLLVQRAVQAMGASGIRFERTRVTTDDGGGGGSSWQNAQWVYRMEPSLDVLGAFETGGKGFGEAGGREKQRFVVRQVLDQEWVKEEKKRAEAVRLARFTGGGEVPLPVSAKGREERRAMAKPGGKRDFFGRPVAVPVVVEGAEPRKVGKGAREQREEGGRVWITYHEGFSNAVRKPVTLAELMRDL